MSSTKRLAVLIDADNTPVGELNNIFEELNAKGSLVVKRAYGDFSLEHLKNWKDELNALAIQPVQQFAYTKGKNATDTRMIIDAMDLLYEKKFDAFVLMSSDSDFTSLASRIRESEIEVIGVGRQHTPKPFRTACDDFIIIETLSAESSEETAEKVIQSVVDKSIYSELELWRLIHQAWQKLRDDEGWVNLGEVGSLLKRQRSDFDTRQYGFGKLSDCIKHFDKKLDIKTKGGVKFRLKVKSAVTT